MNNSAIVVGAGIIGLAFARALSMKGFRVKVIERNHQALGASIRNFGMIWPIGQPDGDLYERAVRSSSIWRKLGTEKVFWFRQSGSLHIAYHPDEWQVLQELNETFRHRRTSLLNAAQIAERSPAVVQSGLRGGLFSEEELLVDPREVLSALPKYLNEKYNVRFLWGKCASAICGHTVHTGRETHDGDVIVICSGADFETLYPEIFDQISFLRCKLQMLRIAAQPGGWKMGPALAGGLSLIHYKSFFKATSLKNLRSRLESEMSDYIRYGIHVMICDNQGGELSVGDSHEYGLSPNPFDKDVINQLILQYLRSFVQLRDWRVTETWNGVYAKMDNDKPFLHIRPEQNVHIVNGVGGAGMTMSFALAEEILSEM